MRQGQTVTVDIEVQHKGIGNYRGYAYVGVPLIAVGSTVEKTNQYVRHFLDELDELLDKHPNIRGCDLDSECESCFRDSLEIIHRNRNRRED